jgi:hypothetical protein
MVKANLSESEVMIRVASIISYLKSETKNDLLTARQSGMISLENKELERICNVIESSIQKNFVKSSGEVTSLFKR